MSGSQETNDVEEEDGDMQSKKKAEQPVKTLQEMEEKGDQLQRKKKKKHLQKELHLQKKALKVKAKAINEMVDDKELAQTIPHWMQRTQILWGSKKMSLLMGAHVLVVGLGGVGGMVAEMIARSGVGKMTIVDSDTVDTTNRNRQVPALASTVGKPKVAVLAERLRDINPDLMLEVKEEFLGEGNTYPIVQAHQYSYVLDCIDTLTSKCWLIRACIENNIPIASSMGAGAKTDPTKATLADISETKYCQFSSAVRRRLRKWNITSGIPVVYSPEPINEGSFLYVAPNQLGKQTVMGTVSYMPAVFGCMLVSVAIREICDGRGTVVRPQPPPPLPSKSKLKRMEHKKRKKEREEKSKIQEGTDPPPLMEIRDTREVTVVAELGVKERVQGGAHSFDWLWAEIVNKKGLALILILILLYWLKKRRS